MLIKLEDAVKAVESVRLHDNGVNRPAISAVLDILTALRALPVSDGWGDMVERVALQNAKEYLQGAGPWKLDEIGITADDYLVRCFAKAIREAALGPLPAPPSE